MVCYRLFLWGVATAALAIGSGCTKQESVVEVARGSGFEVRFDGTVMGTTWSAVVADTHDDSAKLIARVGDAVHGVDARMSTYKPDSEISRFGTGPANTPHEVSADTYMVVEDALRIAAKTGGAFDPTIMPLVDLWGFGPAPTPETAPSAEAIAAAMESCGYQKVSMIEGNEMWALSKSVAALRVDLSAIAKGHGVDAMALAVEERGAQNYLVEIGGELRGKGVSQDGSPWLVGIDAPRMEEGPGRPLQAAVELHDQAIATSGNYRNYRNHTHLTTSLIAAGGAAAAGRAGGRREVCGRTTGK
ncbi:MAG: FAD:protein FMN transferase, partial [Planctomycetota bacterium]